MKKKASMSKRLCGSRVVKLGATREFTYGFCSGDYEFV